MRQVSDNIHLEDSEESKEESDEPKPIRRPLMMSADVDHFYQCEKCHYYDTSDYELWRQKQKKILSSTKAKQNLHKKRNSSYNPELNDQNRSEFKKLTMRHSKKHMKSVYE